MNTEPGFTKGYKYHGYANEPVSDACGDGKHSECTFDLTKCHCKYRAGHNTMHSYANPTIAAAPQPVSGDAPGDVTSENIFKHGARTGGYPCLVCHTTHDTNSGCPAPSPTPSVSKRQSAREWMKQTGEFGTELYSSCGKEMYDEILAAMDEFREYVGTAAAPSVAGTPIKHHPNCVTQASYIAKYSRPDLRGKPCDCGAAAQGTPEPPKEEK